MQLAPARAMSAMRASSVRRFVWANVLGCGDRNEHGSRFGGSPPKQGRTQRGFRFHDGVCRIYRRVPYPGQFRGVSVCTCCMSHASPA
ncbi:hypothetical protein Bcep1808_3685 [Burkholderia vietnamiensis G4]|uniref:Uncharacterized protein n=1 Tax=Burkholderia vietnamiensis (strain G4 / LMG 22486) TaxID=269482 RepID=A4JK67_BURVG|nr:hypothetical protein Bcep1808_3685 [Burkholderia vietnamiensis G4]